MIGFSIAADPLFYVVAVPAVPSIGIAALLFLTGVKLCWDGVRPWIG